MAITNPFDEPSFETSILHYFLFKGKQAETALNRERANSKNGDNATTTPAAASKISVTSTTAANDNQKSTDAPKDDGNKKMPATKDSSSRKSDGSSKKKPAALSNKFTYPTAASTPTAAPAALSNKFTYPTAASAAPAAAAPSRLVAPPPRQLMATPQAPMAGARPSPPYQPFVSGPGGHRYPYPSNFSLGIVVHLPLPPPGVPMPMGPGPGIFAASGMQTGTTKSPTASIGGVASAAAAAAASKKSTEKAPSKLPAASDTAGASTSKEMSTEKDPSKMPAATKTTDASTSKESPEAMDTSTYDSIAAIMAKKYNRLATVMKEEFPLYENMLVPNAPFLAPDISMRYAHFPQVHTEIGFLRQRVFELERQVKHEQSKNFSLRKVFTGSLTGRPAQSRKRGRPVDKITDEDAPTSPPKHNRKYKSLDKRADVPEDIKEQVKRLKKEASNERKNMKQKLRRLEKKVEKTEEKLHQANVSKLKPSPQLKTPPVAVMPPVPMPPVAMAPAVPAKPPPKPKPAEPPATFESRFKELKDYKIANNTCRVPGRIPGLGRWVSDLRKVYKISKERPEILKPRKYGPAADLTLERIDRLNALGFEWEVKGPTVPWQQRFEELVAYKEKNGDTLVPRGYKENPPLGEWVHMQRKLYKQKAKPIQGERTDKLNSIGFAWGGKGMRKLTWEERLEECRNFRREHGHLSVPPPPNPKRESEVAAAVAQTPEERSFQWWAHRQRDQYRRLQVGKSSSLDKRKQKQLDDLGFNWMEKRYGTSGAMRDKPGKPPDEELYLAQVNKLQRVKDLYGDCNDLKNIERAFPDDTKLINWVKTQRKQYRAWKKGEYSSLSKERRLMMEAIGFNFNPRSHYAAYGSKKKAAAAAVADDSGEAMAGAAALQAAAEAAAELEARNRGS